MTEKIRGVWENILHWWPVVISIVALLTGGGMWYQRIDDHFKTIDQQFVDIKASHAVTDKKIEAIQIYLMSSHAATAQSPAQPQYNVFPKKTGKQQPMPEQKHSQVDPFDIFAEQAYQYLDTTNRPHY